MKRVHLIIASSITVMLAAVFFFVGSYISSGRSAREKLEREIVTLNAETKKLGEETDEILSSIDDLDTQLSTRRTVNSYYMEYKKVYDKLSGEVEDLKTQSAKLDSEIESKRNTLEEASGVKTEKRGKSYTLEKNKSYSCPAEIPAGRYTVSGSGTLVITSSSGQVRATQNLDVAYNNSYTFNLSDKERIKSSERVKITQLITN